MDTTTERQPGPRERYRRQVRSEIRELAWGQIAENGATDLSLKSIAKALGMTGPAIYRYVASRDDLLSDLIEEAYVDLGRTLAQVDAPGPVEQVRVLADTFRSWALAQPHRYLLLFGTPVPGYTAPPATQAAATAVMRTILEACGALPDGPEPGDDAVRRLDAHLADHHAWAPVALSGAQLRRGLLFWTRLHGILGLEVAGQFATMGFDPALLFAAEVDALLDA